MQFFKDLNLAAITGFLTAFPKELVAAVVREESHREAALITFLVTLSGVVIAGFGSAFWGVLAGAMALFVQQYGQARRAPLPHPAADSPTISTP